MATTLVGTTEGLAGVGGPLRSGLEGEVTALARGAGSLWAITDGRVVWHSADGPWKPKAEAEAEDQRLNCLVPVDDGAVYVGTSEAHLLRLADGRLGRVEAFDGVEGRGSWHTPWGGPPDVRSLSADGAGMLYANVHVGGIVCSADDGETWTPSGLEIDADVHQVLAHPTRAEVLLAATAYGLAMSKDGGDSWETHDEGLHATYCRAVAVTGDGALVSASAGHHGREAALYRFRGGRFERCLDGLPEWFDDNVDTHCLAAEGRRAALGTADGRVFGSADGGETWEQVAAELGRVTCLLLEG